MKLRAQKFLGALLACGLVAVLALSPVKASAATIEIINQNGAGVGFNDTTPAAPVGGNTGTTLGQQRIIAFQHAANIWGNLLQSAVPIRVGAQFTPLACTANSGTLGSAGPAGVTRDFVNAPYSGTWYPIALASAIAGTDLNPGVPHINANFSSTIGTPGCLEGSGWYFGLDASPPSGKIDFVSVLIHELAHGLGFLTLVDRNTGAKAGGFDDTYMRHLEHHGAFPASYPSMTDAQRLAASVSTGNLHWTGPNVRAAVGLLTNGQVGDHVKMFAPNPVQMGSSVSHFDTSLVPNQIMEPSYTEPLHTPVLELPLFKDIGWTVSSAPPSYYSLAVSKTGLGTVYSNPSGINCGSDCNENYASGTSVTLNATPGSGYTFSGWSGACSGTTPSCTVTMNTAKSVAATFTQTPQATISIANVGSGAGTVVRSAGEAINCGNNCTETLPIGALITLTATPALGSTFAGWSGSTCAGTGTCSFNLTANTTVTAQFNSISGGSTTTPLLVTNVLGVAESIAYYSINVPARSKNLKIQIRGGTGDADLYVKFDQVPTTDSYDCRPYLVGNNETCTFSQPTAGTYHIMLRGYEQFGGLTLTASYQKPVLDLTPILNLLLD